MARPLLHIFDMPSSRELLEVLTRIAHEWIAVAEAERFARTIQVEPVQRNG